MLKYYYDALITNDQGYSFETLKMQYEVALMDLVRFLIGWSRQKTEGMDSCYAYIRVLKLLEELRDGETTMTEQEYSDRINLKYNF